MHPIYEHLSETQKSLVEKHFEEMLCNQHTILSPDFVEKLKFKYYKIVVVDELTHVIGLSFKFNDKIYAASFIYTQDEFSGRIELSDWFIMSEDD